LSAALGLWPAADARRLRLLIERAGLPVLAPPMPLDRWFELMRVDKKAEGGEIRFVVIETTGHATMCTATDALVRQVILQHSAGAA
ncbi:MAG TPA: 3-dehydroquinate synthase, partial [Rubrivivax sp.]|nr:3-dehydroquinate synthase [Rubrivivax sp.]